MIKTYRYRMYPNEQQVDMLSRHFGCYRWVYNWALGIKTKAWEDLHTTIHVKSLSARLPALRKQEDTKWLSEVYSQCLQYALRRLDVTFSRFFKNDKGYPRFKSKRSRQSFSYPQHVTIDAKSETAYLPKIGDVKISMSREPVGKIKIAHIVKVPSGKYFINVVCEDGAQDIAECQYGDDTTTGVDLGLTSFAALSTGEKIPHPRYLRGLTSRIKKESIRLSRKAKGSKNREKQRIRLALVHEKITNSRNDFLHKLSRRLVNENQALAFEDLHISGMIRNSSLHNSMSDAAWGRFVLFCGYKAKWDGKVQIKIGRFEPSSKLSDCGFVNMNLSLRDRIWTCPSCGNVYDRDVQAARNIKRIALESVRQGMPKPRLVEVGVSRPMKQEPVYQWDAKSTRTRIAV